MNGDFLQQPRSSLSHPIGALHDASQRRHPGLAAVLRCVYPRFIGINYPPLAPTRFGQEELLLVSCWFCGTSGSYSAMPRT